MTKIDTLLRVVYTLGVSLILSQSASAQSVLNFARTTVNDQQNAGIAVTNPTSSYANVQFTLYGSDGDPVSSGLVNPVSYRIAPKGQLSMLASDIFATLQADGWIQVTSPTSGLTGSYLSGNFSSKLAGSQAEVALTEQIIPLIREDQRTTTELVVINPNSGNSSATVTFFNSMGEEIATTVRSLGSHAALRLHLSALMSSPAAGDLSARISSSTAVIATATIETNNTLIFAAGQRLDFLSARRIAPHFIFGSGFDSSLILTNPNATSVLATVTAFSENGGPIFPGQQTPSSLQVTLAPYGSVSLSAGQIAQRPFTPSIEGWLRIDSANVPLTGLVILDRSSSSTAEILESAPVDRMLYSQVSETATWYMGLALLNPSPEAANVQFGYMRSDGATYAERTIRLPGNSKFSSLVREILPQVGGQEHGTLLIRSSIAIYGVGILGSFDGQFLTSLNPSLPPEGFAPDPILQKPVITRIEPDTDVRPGMTLRVTASEVSADAVFVLGDKAVSTSLFAPGSVIFSPRTLVFSVDVPTIEPGLANLRIRSNGMDSAPIYLHILPADNLPTQTISGRAFYQKLEVTDAGLDLSHPVMVPIRNARIEVVDRSLQSVVAVSETDGRGQFQVPVPFEPNLTIRVVSDLRTANLRVADNTNLNTLYSISVDVDAREQRPNVVLADNTRVSGAFNILEMVQRGNDTIRVADPRTVPPPVTVFWSTRNTPRAGNIRDGLVGTTFFSIATNSAFVLGDRNVDSDEFDDSVILHEYAHMLAARFSRDDSPGHSHGIGDMLDPRVSWSEGWANFFSSAVRNDPFYRDSMGPNGVNVLRYDLEDNIPPNDKPGYWSEASVQSLLWDLYDDHADAGDNVQFPISLIWSAFADLRNDRFVYLPYFLERFLARNPAAADAVRSMAQLRSIDFQPNVRPSVSNPFPRPISVGEPVTGEVDSLTYKKGNLIQSAHYMSFTTTGGAASIRMDIIGLGPADDPNANDLDLFLMDANGRLLVRSDRGLNGQSELISMVLPPGTYIVEVRSYYTKAETNSLVFNSGRYRLGVSVQ